MKLLIALLASVMLLSACDQDPIKNASAIVREGRPPATNKPTPEKAVDPNGMQIDGPESYRGRINSPMEFKITGRVLLEGLEYEMSVDNLADFPGATYDETTGDFRWVPMKGAVGSLPASSFELRVTMYSIPNAKYNVITAKRKTIYLTVENSYGKPIMNKIEGESTLKVGTRYVMSFMLEDYDAQSASDVNVVVKDCGNSYVSSISHLVRVIGKITASPTTAGVYTGEVAVEMNSGADGLKDADYCFALAAISKHGVTSEVINKRVTVEAKIYEPKMTNGEIYVNVGEVMRASFSIYDPSGNGAVSMKFVGDLSINLPGSTLACSQTANRYIVNCFARVDARTAKPGEHRIRMTSENKSTAYGSKQTITTDHTLYVSVKAVLP
ncbi:hypothetical protein D3C87_124240 [compost metagenome]